MAETFRFSAFLSLSSLSSLSRALAKFMGCYENSKQEESWQKRESESARNLGNRSLASVLLLLFIYVFLSFQVNMLRINPSYNAFFVSFNNISTYFFHCPPAPALIQPPYSRCHSFFFYERCSKVNPI